jgi:hypothetical protein
MLLVLSLFSLAFLSMSPWFCFPLDCTVYSFCVGVCRVCSWLQCGQWRNLKNLTLLPSVTSNVWTNNVPSRTVCEEVTLLCRWNSIVWLDFRRTFATIQGPSDSFTAILHYSELEKEYAYIHTICLYLWECVCVSVWECVGECGWEWVRERVCVCVCVCERKISRRQTRLQM